MGRPQGAYGLRVRGLADDLLLTLPDSAAWPEVSIARRIATPVRRGHTGVGPESADVPLLRGDRVVATRRNRSAALLTSAPEDDGTLLHPFLTAVGVIFAWWDGRHAFHGGAFLDPSGRAWCVMGDRGAGKSSTLARLWKAGSTVLSDDLLVLDDGLVTAGPRCIDLRPDAAAGLEVTGQATSVRAGERLRLTLPSAPVAAPLHGWIFLGWGDCIDIRRLGAGEWLARLAAHRTTATEHAPSLVALAGRPTLELVRPPGWGSLESAVERLLDLVGG